MGYEANSFVWSKVGHAALKLFGGDGESPDIHGKGLARVHDGVLLPKKVRGRRENVLRAEISRLLRNSSDKDLAGIFRSALHEGDGSEECVVALTNHIHEGIMKK